MRLRASTTGSCTTSCSNSPSVVGDVLLAYFISRYVKIARPTATNTALVVWLFSPYSIIISSIWGMFDCLAMLPVVLALNMRTERYRPALAGLAIWVKSIPLIFAIPLAYSSGKNELRNLIIAVAVPVLATLAVIAVTGWPFLTAVTTLNSTVTKAGQSLSGVGAVFYLFQLGAITTISTLELKILGYLWLPGVLVAAFLGERWYGFTTDKGLVQSLLLCAVTFMLLKAQVNEQYATYILALALIDIAVWNPERKWLYLGLSLAVMAFILINNVYLVRFLAPIYPGWGNLENAIIQSQGPWRFPLLFASSLAFVATNAVYLWVLFRDRTRTTTTTEGPAPSPAPASVGHTPLS